MAKNSLDQFDPQEILAYLQGKAPEGHFLAFINDKEGQMLKNAGGSGQPDPETGIPSYEGEDFGGYDFTSYDFGTPDQAPSYDYSSGSSDPYNFGSGTNTLGDIYNPVMPDFSTPDYSGGDFANLSGGDTGGGATTPAVTTPDMSGAGGDFANITSQATVGDATVTPNAVAGAGAGAEGTNMAGFEVPASVLSFGQGDPNMDQAVTGPATQPYDPENPYNQQTSAETAKDQTTLSDKEVQAELDKASEEQGKQAQAKAPAPPSSSAAPKPAVSMSAGSGGGGGGKSTTTSTLPKSLLDALGLTSKNALPLAAAGATALAKKPGANIGQAITAAGQPTADQSAKLLAQYNAGQINPSDQKAVDDFVNAQTAQIKQRYAKMGRDPNYDSAAQNELANVAVQAGAMKDKALQGILTQGLKAAATSQDPAIKGAIAQYNADVNAQKGQADFLKYLAQMQSENPKPATPVQTDQTPVEQNPVDSTDVTTLPA